MNEGNKQAIESNHQEVALEHIQKRIEDIFYKVKNKDISLKTFGLNLTHLLDEILELDPNFAEARTVRENTWHKMLECYRDLYQQEYLKSPAWSEKKTEVLARDRSKCCDCDSNLDLHIHHETYDNIGKEDISDLVTLCNTCHKKRHDDKILIPFIKEEKHEPPESIDCDIPF